MDHNIFRMAALAAIGSFILGIIVYFSSGNNESRPVALKPKPIEEKVLSKSKLVQKENIWISMLSENHLTDEPEPVSHWIGCEEGMREEVFRKLSDENKEVVLSHCVGRYRNSKVLRFFLSRLNHLDGQYIGIAKAISENTKTGVRAKFVNSASCELREKHEQLTVWEGFTLASALKALLLGGLTKEAEVVMANIKSGQNPEHSLAGTEIEKLAHVNERGNSKSLRVFYSIPLGDILEQVSDKKIFKITNIALPFLRVNLRRKIRKFSEILLRGYRRSLEIFSQSRTNASKISHKTRGLSITLIATPFIGAYPTGEAYISCTEYAVQKFWARRFLEGNHVRVRGLIQEIVKQL